MKPDQDKIDMESASNQPYSQYDEDVIFIGQFRSSDELKEQIRKRISNRKDAKISQCSISSEGSFISIYYK